jgi:hypothetical protein
MEGKGNDGKGNIESRDDWQTPQWLFDLLNKQYVFKFDCCATKHNHKCLIWSKSFEIEKEINVVSWMNPPFSKAKEMFSHFFKEVKQGVAIYRSDNLETRIWQDIILEKADWIFIPKGRIVYQYNPLLRNGKGSRFPSALIGVGLEPVIGIEGKLLLVNKKGKEGV